MNGSANDPHRYDDIIDLPRHVSKTHPQMSPENRAAQFSPFAAVVGYEAAIQETARLTDRRIELDNDEKIMLSGKLQLIQDNIKAQPQATITYFQPDEKKTGGAYIAVTGVVKKVDAYARQIVMTDKKSIPINDVIAIDGELFRGMDEDFA